MNEKISACVICFNEEDKIARCLESLTWCDEIVVVDSFSTDQTVEICRRYTEQVHQHEWTGYIGQRNYIRGLAKHPWVLFLDADEVVSDALRKEIIREFAQGPGAYTGYQFPRQVNYLNKWIRFGEWYPDIKLRLFRKSQGTIVGEEPHDHVEVDGPVKTLRGRLLHYTYDDISDHLETVNRFSSISAEGKFKSGGTFHWGALLFRPMWRFFKGYFIRLGFLNGRRGILIAMIASFEVAMKYAKFWELTLQHRLNEKKEKPDAASGRKDDA